MKFTFLDYYTRNQTRTDEIYLEGKRYTNLTILVGIKFSISKYLIIIEYYILLDSNQQYSAPKANAVPIQLKMLKLK